MGWGSIRTKMVLLPSAVLFAGIFIAAAGEPCQPSIAIESLTATSANISWSASCTVDEAYVFRWRLEGPCSTSAQQERRLDASVTSYFLTNLEEYSRYLTYVDAVFTGNEGRASERVFFTTRQAPASRAPSFLNASHVNSTAVLVAWGGIACSHQNGNISLFELDITLAGRSRRVRVGGDASEGGMSVLTGLQPGNLYSIRVAAVNLDDQTGVFTSVATIQTMEAAPTDAPQNFIIRSSEDDPARGLLFSWDPPSMPNGQITHYTLTCTTQLPDTGSVLRVLNITSAGTSNQVEVSGFSPSTTYNCSLMATNVIGDSPLAYTTATTEDDAKLFQIFLILSKQEKCMEWVANDTQAKRENITNEVQTVVESLCQCELPADHFSDAQLHCVGPTEGQAVYQATMHGTLHNTSSFLISTLEEWVGGGNATVTVLGVELLLNSSCKVSISSFGNPVCEEGDEEHDSEGLPLPLWAIVVAAVGGLIVALSLTLLVCICCCCAVKRLWQSKNPQTLKPDPEVKVEPDSRHDVVELQTKSVLGRKGEDDTNHYYATAHIPVKVQSASQSSQTPGPDGTGQTKRVPESKREDDTSHYYTTVEVKVHGPSQNNQTPPEYEFLPALRHDVVELQTRSVPGRKGEDDTNHYYATAHIPVKVQSVSQSSQTPGPNGTDQTKRVPESKREDDTSHYYTTVEVKVHGASQNDQTPPEYEFLPAL